MIPIRPPISNSSSPLSKPLGTISSTPVTIGIIVQFIAYYNYYYLLLESFSHQHQLIVFQWSLSDCKFPQIPKAFLSTLAVLNNAVFSKSSSPFNNPLVTVPKAPITIDIIVTFMFHSFSISSQGRGTYPSFHFFPILFCGPQEKQSRQFCNFSFFFCCWLLLGLVFWPKFGDPCVCESPIGVYMWHFHGQMLDCAYTIYS